MKESNKLDKMYTQAMDALKLHHFDEAISLLDTAARQGSLAAILRIAGVYYFGIGVEPDTDKAIEYLRYDPEFGARPVKRAIQRSVLND